MRCHQNRWRHQCPSFVTSEKADSQKVNQARKSHTSKNMCGWVCAHSFMCTCIYTLPIYCMHVYVCVHNYLLYVHTITMLLIYQFTPALNTSHECTHPHTYWRALSSMLTHSQSGVWKQWNCSVDSICGSTGRRLIQ